MKSILTFLLIGASVPLPAQQYSRGQIAATVIHHQNTAAENATVELLKAQDSSLVKAAFTDMAGKVDFEQVPYGSYIIKTTMVAFAPQYSSAFSLSAGKLDLPVIILKPAAAQLANVTITRSKPFIQKLADRIVVNMENSIISAGSSAMDVLERSPGININQDDGISLRGKSGVVIMIDGKPAPMTGSDLANYLKGLPSAAIERIDIITNPSARYDAAGNSGIIDIRLKKDQRFGANGTATAGYGQGVYAKANAGTTLNYRNKKMNVFGNYNYAYRIGLNHLIIDRNFYETGNYNGGDLKDNYSKSPGTSHTSRFGIDFFPSKKTVIGIVINGNFNHYTRTSSNKSIVINPQHQAVNTFNSNAANNDHANNYVANINFKHTFDSTGKELTADADYGEYTSTSLTRNSTDYYKLDGTALLLSYTLDGNQKGKLAFKTAKVDYTHTFGQGGKWETGAKTSYVSSDNDARFFDVSSGTPQNDVNKTNHFVYEEYNNAAYINFSRELKKFDIQIGLRGEHTKVKTWQEMGNIKFDSSYFQLFPSAFFNYKIMEEKTIGLSVSRRIDRPGYSQLNPFLFLIDVTTFATGRPGLLPQLTWAYEISYTVKSLSFSFNYSHTKDNQNIILAWFKEVFPNIPSPDNVTVQIPYNLSSSDYYSLSVSAPVKINRWWNIENNGNLYYEKFNGYFSGTVLKNGKPAADIRTNNTFTFTKGWSAELNASLNTGGQYGFMVLSPQWALSTGVQKTILNKKGTIRFNITDIFWTNLPKAVVTYTNYIERWRAYRESRVANISFTYRFGNNKIQASRRRTTASEEERQRAQ